MAKSLSYWRAEWEAGNENNAWKTLKLLSIYAGFFQEMPLSTTKRAWGGCIGRLFSGRWNTHHGSKVQTAIADFYHSSSQYALEPRYHDVEFVLALVKREVGDYNNLNPHGDLARILHIIKQKTLIDYAEIEADDVINLLDQDYYCTL